MNIPRLLRLLEAATTTGMEFLARNGTLTTFTHRGPEEVQRILSTMPHGPAKSALANALDQYVGVEGVYDFGTQTDPHKNPQLVSACQAADAAIAKLNLIAA